jgi:hypothetical protein
MSHSLSKIWKIYLITLLLKNISKKKHREIGTLRRLVRVLPLKKVKPPIVVEPPIHNKATITLTIGTYNMTFDINDRTSQACD